MMLEQTRRLSAMMDDGFRISHPAVGHHVFDVLHQTVTLLLQAQPDGSDARTTFSSEETTERLEPPA